MNMLKADLFDLVEFVQFGSTIAAIWVHIAYLYKLNEVTSEYIYIEKI